jgi:predicted Rossmann fold nucleotide-binding protein DprA/Smf involved in DNA uptake
MTTGLKIAVIGSRSIDKINLSEYINAEEVETIISGGAKGVDTIAEQWAKRNGIKTIIIKPEYSKYGKGAPLRRNHTIVEQADKIIAFWNGESRGTKYTIELARKAGKEIRVIAV